MIKRFAAVDVGTNTIKINIMDYFGEDHFEEVLYKDFPSYLGRSMNKGNIIDVTALAECYSALNAIRKIMKKNKVEKYKCIATHALREAENQKEILALIRSNTGINVNVITGVEEAKLTLKAVLIDFSATKNFVCINAGGGSTELIFHLPDFEKKEQLYFFRFGAVNLLKEFIKDSSDIEGAISEIGTHISQEYNKLNILIPWNIDQVVSVGGSIYNAAYIFKKDKKRNFNKLASMRLSNADMESLINQLKFAGEEEKKKMPGMDQKRSDTILPGVLIYYFLLKLLRRNELVISTRSISDGLIRTMAERKIVN